MLTIPISYAFHKQTTDRMNKRIFYIYTITLLIALWTFAACMISIAKSAATNPSLPSPVIIVEELNPSLNDINATPATMKVPPPPPPPPIFTKDMAKRTLRMQQYICIVFICAAIVYARNTVARRTRRRRFGGGTADAAAILNTIATAVNVCLHAASFGEQQQTINGSGDRTATIRIMLLVV